MEYPYLSDPAFAESHVGPLVVDGQPYYGRDPDSAQIAARCEAIRKACPRDPAGPRSEWTAPEVTEDALSQTGV